MSSNLGESGYIFAERQPVNTSTSIAPLDLARISAVDIADCRFVQEVTEVSLPMCSNLPKTRIFRLEGRAKKRRRVSAH